LRDLAKRLVRGFSDAFQMMAFMERLQANTHSLTVNPTPTGPQEPPLFKTL
jgi:hypothetical protein